MCIPILGGMIRCPEHISVTGYNEFGAVTETSGAGPPLPPIHASTFFALAQLSRDP